MRTSLIFTGMAIQALTVAGLLAAGSKVTPEGEFIVALIFIIYALIRYILELKRSKNVT